MKKTSARKKSPVVPGHRREYRFDYMKAKPTALPLRWKPGRSLLFLIRTSQRSSSHQNRSTPCYAP